MMVPRGSPIRLSNLDPNLTKNPNGGTGIDDGSIVIGPRNVVDDVPILLPVNLFIRRNVEQINTNSIAAGMTALIQILAFLPPPLLCQVHHFENPFPFRLTKVTLISQHLSTIRLYGRISMAKFLWIA